MRECPREGQLRRWHLGGIERSVFRQAGNENLLAIGSGHANKAAVNLWRVVFRDLIVHIIFTALNDVDDKHVSDRSSLIDQRLFQRLLKIAFQSNVPSCTK